MNIKKFNVQPSMQFIAIFLTNLSFVASSSLNMERMVSLGLEKDGIELTISNIRNNKGLIRIGMYNSETGYPHNPLVSFTLAKNSLAAGKLQLFIPLKEAGSFAISILDDENENGKMDYMFGIMPKEGFGFSNNPKIRGMKEPPYSETSFPYIGGKKVVTITMIYI